MCKINEADLEWAKVHLNNFFDSDFLPRLFEFKCFNHNWENVKEHILSLNINKGSYYPYSSLNYLAFKNTTSFRVVHQLDPIDSLILTSLCHEVCKSIEEYRIPEDRHIACSYRIKTDVKGSFFNSETNGWENYISKINLLSEEFSDGYVLECDIADFYNQIYLHRVQNVIAESGRGSLNEVSNSIENFLMGINKKTSRGVPVGPASSIIFAEAVMSDIDRFILRQTDKFTRYVDDFKIFFKTYNEARDMIYTLTEYLYSPHRLVLSTEKTRILTVSNFRENNNIDNESEIQNRVLKEALDLTDELYTELLEEFEDEEFDPYITPNVNFDELLEKTLEKEKIKLLSSAYNKIIHECIVHKRDYGLLRHIYRKATVLRIKGIISITLDNIEELLPVIREVVLFLNRNLNESNISRYADKFSRIKSLYIWKYPYINRWLSFLFQNDAFNSIDNDIDYSAILEIRDQALVALRRKDITWVKLYKEKIDTLNPWDKRAIVYASQLLSKDEVGAWLDSVVRDDIVLKSIGSYVKNLSE